MRAVLSLMCTHLRAEPQPAALTAQSVFRLCTYPGQLLSLWLAVHVTQCLLWVSVPDRLLSTVFRPDSAYTRLFPCRMEAVLEGAALFWTTTDQLVSDAQRS